MNIEDQEKVRRRSFIYSGIAVALVMLSGILAVVVLSIPAVEDYGESATLFDACVSSAYDDYYNDDFDIACGAVYALIGSTLMFLFFASILFFNASVYLCTNSSCCLGCGVFDSICCIIFAVGMTACAFASYDAVTSVKAIGCILVILQVVIIICMVKAKRANVIIVQQIYVPGVTQSVNVSMTSSTTNTSGGMPPPPQGGYYPPGYGQPQQQGAGAYYAPQGGYYPQGPPPSASQQGYYEAKPGASDVYGQQQQQQHGQFQGQPQPWQQQQQQQQQPWQQQQQQPWQQEQQQYGGEPAQQQMGSFDQPTSQFGQDVSGMSSSYTEQNLLFQQHQQSSVAAYGEVDAPPSYSQHAQDGATAEIDMSQPPFPTGLDHNTSEA